MSIVQEKIKVKYDIDDQGFLVTKTKEFLTLQEAMDFVRRIAPHSLTLPMIEEE